MVSEKPLYPAPTIPVCPTSFPRKYLECSMGFPAAILLLPPNLHLPYLVSRFLPENPFFIDRQFLPMYIP